MSQNQIKTSKRLWILAILNMAMIGLALVVNLLWIYPHESDNTISYLWNYKYQSFLFITIPIASVGILFGGNKWRVALAALATLQFGEKVLDQFALIVTRYEVLNGMHLGGELFGVIMALACLAFNYWALLSKKSNQYFTSKAKK